MGNAPSSNGSLKLVINPPSSISSASLHYGDDKAMDGYYIAGSTITGVVYAQRELNPPINTAAPAAVSNKDATSPIHNHSTGKFNPNIDTPMKSKSIPNIDTPIQSNKTKKKLASSSLRVCLTGEEHVKVGYRDTEHYYADGAQTRRVTKHAHACREIVRISIPIVSNVQELSGRYECPFRVVLPKYVPSSMNHNGNGGYCKIVYRIKAEIIGSWFGGHKQEYELPVLGMPMPFTPVPYSLQPFTTKLKYFWCFDRKPITLGVAVDDTRVTRGEQLHVSFSCKNQSSVEIEYISAIIRERTWWKASGHHTSSTSPLVSQNFQKSDNMLQLSKSDLSSVNGRNNDDSTTKTNKIDSIVREIYNDIQNNENVVSLFIPHEAKHSYVGKFCGVEHSLTITMKTSGGVNNPEVTIPLQIGTTSEGPNLSPTSSSSSSSSSYWNPLQEIPTAPPSPTPLSLTPPVNWEADVISPPVIAPFSNLVYIGALHENEENIDLNHEPSSPVIASHIVKPSIKSLINELKVSVSASSTIKERIHDSNWIDQIFSTMTPRQFVSIVTSVTIKFDQAEVASIISSVINNFTCESIVLMIRSVPDWMRVTMVQRLIPHAKDLNANAEQILVELSAWEKLSTERDFNLQLGLGKK